MCKGSEQEAALHEGDISTVGPVGKAASGLQLEIGPEVGTGVLGAGHLQTQMAPDLTHFPRGKTRSGRDAKTWQRWTKMMEWRSQGGEQRAGLGESGVGHTVSH